MATSMLPIRPVGVIACASTTGHRKPEANNINRRGASSSSYSSSSANNWWAPLFGWSKEPDYIDSENNKKISASATSRSGSDQDCDPKLTVRSRFTEEKARQLRKMTAETTTFHDVMYHSAIASRLASDYCSRSDP